MRHSLLFALLIVGCSNPPIVPPTPSNWEVTGAGQSGVPGYRLPSKVVVRVVDSDGRPVVGDTIDFTSSDALAFVEPGPVVVTDSTGSAGVFWRLGSTLGSQTLIAHSRVPGVSEKTIVATSASNAVQSIASVGDNGFCAVDLRGALGCWLPPRPNTADLHSAFIPVSAPVHFTQVAMVSAVPNSFNGYGPNSKGCALADTGRPWCFSLDTVANVVGLAELPGNYPIFTQLYGGGWNAGAFCALTVPGEAWCWGSNDGGQLGDGTTVSHASPAAVASTARFASLDLSAAGACGLTVDGAAWCWGAIGTAAGQANGVAVTPNAVTTSLRFTKVRSIAAVDVSCGIATSGGMYCWGGLAGSYSTSHLDTAIPVAVPEFAGVADMFEGGGFIMLLDQRAGIQWGGDPNPTLVGDRGSLPFSSRFPVVGLLRDIRLAHGFRYSCGTAAVGTGILCVSNDGLFYLTLEHRPPLEHSAVIGVPFAP